MFDLYCELVFGKPFSELRYADLRTVRTPLSWNAEELKAVDVLFVNRNAQLGEEDLQLTPVGEGLRLDYRGGSVFYMAGDKLVVVNGERPDMAHLWAFLSRPGMDFSAIFNHLKVVQETDFTERIQQAAKENLEKMLNEAVAELSSALQTEKREKKESYERALQQMRNAYNAYLQYDFINEEDYRKQLRETLEKEITLIQNHKKVERIEFTADGMNIFTSDLIMYEPHANTHYFLGSMKVEFKLGNRQEVRFFNQTGTVDAFFSGAHHPHVDGSGYPCLGNIESQMHQYLVERQYYAAFITALGYLQTANVEDVAGRSITRWNKCDAEGNILERQDHSEDEWDEDYGDYEDTEEEDEDFNEATTGDAEPEEMWCTVCDGLLEIDNQQRCDECGHMAHKTCGQYVDGLFVCEDCLDNRDEEFLYYCSICHTYHRAEFHPSVWMTFRFGNTELVCQEHAPDTGWRCQNCNEWFHNEVESRPGEIGPCCLESCL